MGLKKYLCSILSCFCFLLPIHYSLGKTNLPVAKVIISWQPQDKAVSYNLNLIAKDGTKIATIKDLFATGFEVTDEDLPQDLNINPQELYYQVQGLDYYKQPIGEPTEPQLLLQGRTFRELWQEATPKHEQGVQTAYEPENYLVDHNLLIPPMKSTAEFKEMAYPLLYPTFSWVPVKEATNYQIQVDKIAPDGTSQRVETITVGDTYDYYSEHSYHEPGDYRYKIIAYKDHNQVLANSPLTYFHIPKQIDMISLGDSITHGGGAISTPPSQRVYNWQSYVAYPIFNAGYSGNTTAKMLQRLDKDVLSFKPKYVFVMGGINDLRAGIKGEKVIANLAKIQQKITAAGAQVIFLTTPPLNTELTTKHVAKPHDNWQKEWAVVNNWLREQPNYLDVATFLTDENGQLKAELTTDGLHPDQQGKAIIGCVVNHYLHSQLEKGDTMEDMEKLLTAQTAVDQLCSHCSFCTPDCYVYKAKEALNNLRYDWEQYHQQQQEQETVE